MRQASALCPAAGARRRLAMTRRRTGCAVGTGEPGPRWLVTLSSLAHCRLARASCHISVWMYSLYYRPAVQAAISVRDGES